MPSLFRVFRKKEKSEPTRSMSKSKSGKSVTEGKPPLQSALSADRLKCRNSKKSVTNSAHGATSAASTRSLANSISSKRRSSKKEEKKQPLNGAGSSSGSLRSSHSAAVGLSLSDASPPSQISPPHSHATTSAASSCNNSDAGGDDSSHEQSSTSSSNFKKASLRRSGSLSGSNPKSLAHSTSAIGLDEMIEDRREVGHLGQNVVHIEVPFGKPIEEVYEGVHNGPVLGSGISGMVRLVTHKATGLKYAVKVLDLGLVAKPNGLQQLREEIFIMCQLDHPNIVRLEEVYESQTEIYLVQELCLGGELFDRLDEQPDYHYTEAECARLVKQMLSAVRYLHSKGIIHRDLKLENFLFSSVHPDSELKMIDFGLSKHFHYGEVHHEAVGTPYTVAPEVIRGSYDERCDIWAIGVISFLLLSGEPPFGGCGGPEPLMTVRSNILRGNFAFEPADVWELVSQHALRFIQSLLVTEPQLRPTAQEAQQHEWFQEWARRKPRQNGDHVLNPNVVKALVNFKEFSDMRKLLCEVLSFTLLPDQIKDLRQEFEKMDTDGSGEISLSALKQVLMQNAGAGSLGALTEEEVTDIFDAMRVRKTETRIHWHEFIAAGLSQCSVDDRNLRLAFERLDSDHKGYITLDDIMDLMGSDALQSEEAMRRMWGDSIKAVKCQHARITYDDFLLLMKGQTREQPLEAQPQGSVDLVAAEAMLGSSLSNLKAVPESAILEHTNSEDQDDVHQETKDDPEDPTALSVIPPNSIETLEEQFAKRNTSRAGTSLGGSYSAPSTPADHKKIIDLDDREDDEDMDSPLSMDDGLPTQPSLTPPITPERGARDYISPLNQEFTYLLPSQNNRSNSSSLLVPSFPETPLGGPYVRRRSRSLGQEHEEEPNSSKDNSENKEDGDHNVADVHAVAYAVRDLLLPETDHGAHVPPELEQVVKDKSKSALVVNRRLYRAHRQMRMAVLEASKRFEEQQAQHAKEVILAQRNQDEEDAGGESHMVHAAGLVMRHGHTKQVSSEAIRKMLAKDRAEQQSLVEKATRRGGRGRRSRKKTISDMSGMLSNAGAENFALASTGHNPAAASSSASNNSSVISVSEPFTPDSSDFLSLGDQQQAPPPHMQREEASELLPDDLTRRDPSTASTASTTSSTQPDANGGNAKEGSMRSATVPGEFIKTSDPFLRYGARRNWQ